MEEELPGFLKYHLTTPEKDDCFFVFKTENEATEKVGAKKQFLMAYSETFRRMLEESPLAEKDDIHVDDIKVEAFKNLLKWLYGRGISVIRLMSVEELIDLLYVAEKYLVEDLKPVIADLIVDRLDLKNIFYVISNQVCLQGECLEKEISDFVCINIKSMLENEDFLQMESKTMLWILQQPSLNVSEIFLWEALVKWAKYKFETEEKKESRSDLVEYIKHIRFGSISRDELCEKIVPTDILLPEQVIEVIKYSRAGRAVQISPPFFVCEPRKKILGKTKFMYFMNNIRPTDFQKPYESQTFEICDLDFNIEIKKKDDFVSFYLNRNKSNGATWPISYKCSMAIINQMGKENKVSSFTRTEVEAQGWGYPKFIEISKIIDPKNGFIMNNSIVAKVVLKITHISK